MTSKRWLQRQRIKAVHDNDLEQWLASLGMLDQVKSGKYHCPFCEREISLENLGAVLPKNGNVLFACDHIRCLGEIECTR